MFGLNFDSLTVGLIALTINNGGYMTEIIRSGINAIHRNEIDAALAIGMNLRQVYLNIVIPHVFRLVYFPMVNQYVLLILGSSILALIGLKDLTFEARMLEAYTFRSFEIYISAMVMYVLLTFLASYILRLVGWKYLRGKKRLTSL
jgi:polar amino acid transport system permease protein